MTDGTNAPAGVTPTAQQGGGMPPESSGSAGGTPTGQTLAPGAGQRDADGSQDADGGGGRDAHAPEVLRRALEAERASRKDAEKELARLRDAEKQRSDAEKSELQLATERADAAEARASTLEREGLARQVAAESGIPSWWDTLQGDDVRSLRASASKMRERLGMDGGGGMDGGVRGTTVPGQPASMDDLIRAGARR
jgi:hypothetical protein